MVEGIARHAAARLGHPGLESRLPGAPAGTPVVCTPVLCSVGSGTTRRLHRSQFNGLQPALGLKETLRDAFRVLLCDQFIKTAHVKAPFSVTELKGRSHLDQPMSQSLSSEHPFTGSCSSPANRLVLRTSES